MRKTFLLLFLFSGCLVSCSGEDLPGTGPIVYSEKGLLEKDHMALRMRWAEKHLLPAAEKGWQGQPWEQQAREVAGKGLRLWFEGPFEAAKEEEKTVEAARALLRTECAEPLACLMAHKILAQLKRDWWGGFVGLSRAFRVVDDAGVPGALRVWIADEQTDRMDAVNWVWDHFHLRQVDRIVAALSDGSYGPGFDEVLVRDVIDWMTHTKKLDTPAFEKLAKAIADSPHGEWARECLLGDLHVHWAWHIRGGGYASEVSEDAWPGFREHLQKASAHLQKAHELRPERPEASGRMIQVVMGGGGDVEDLREWFDTCTSAQFDYPNAYTGLVYACLPRWGGSEELVLALAARFAETGRFDTDVPEQFFHACKQMAMERGSARAVFSSPGVRPVAAAYAEGLLKHREKNPARAVRARGLAAVTAWLAGDDALATRALGYLKGTLPASVCTDLNHMMFHSSRMRTSVYAGNGGWGEDVRSLELRLRAGDRAGQAEALTALKPESLSTDSARGYVEEIRAMAELPEKLRDGGWHPLPVFPGLRTCLADSEHWRATADGEITLYGRDAAFQNLAFPVPVGEAFEVRGEVVYELNETAKWFAEWSFGPALRWIPARLSTLHQPPAVRGLTYHQKDGVVEARITGSMYNEIQGRDAVELKPVNTFHAALDGDEMTFTINDTALPAQDIRPFQLRQSRGLPAFTAFNLPTGIKIRLRHLEVRRAR